MRKQYFFRPSPQGLLAWDVDRLIARANGEVMDGRHRIAKAALLGHETIECVRFVEEPPPDHVGKQPHNLPYD